MVFTRTYLFPTNRRSPKRKIQEQIPLCEGSYILMLQKFGNELSAKLRAGLNLYLWALAQDEKFRDFIQKSRLKNIFTKDTRKKNIGAQGDN